MNQRQILLALLGTCLLLALLPAFAADRALSVRLPVESQLPEVREQAMRQGLSQVLLRLTGRDDIAETEAAALLERPGRYLQRYQYETEAGQRLMLLMQFDGQAVRRALAELGIETWRAERPPVLVWLAVEQPGGRVLVGGEEGVGLRAQLQAAATRRGVQLLFPLMDSEDRQRISSTDVFGGFIERIQQASERYGAAVILTGRMHPQSGGWAARWILSGVDAMSWNMSALSQEELLDAAAAELARRLRARYAMLPGAGAEIQQLVIEVQGVSTLRDYTRLERRLREVLGVTGLRPLRLEPNAVALQLMLDAPPQRVLGLLERDRLLVHLPVLDSEADAAPGSQVPVYRLAP